MLETKRSLMRPMNRRIFLGGLAGTAGLLAGCGSSSAPGTVTLKFWGGVPPENGPAALVEAFNKKNPGINVVYTRFVNDDQGNVKLDTALASGSSVDVFMSYTAPLMTRRIDSGLAVDLGSYIDGDSKVKEWVETSSNSIFTHKDKVWGLPSAREASYIFINKNMVDEVGITLPESWTIDEYRDIARQLSKNNVAGCFSPPDTVYATLGANSSYNSDGTASNFDHPIFKQQYQLHHDMIQEKSAFAWTEVLAQNLRVYAQSIFLKGQVAMATSSNWWHRYITDTEDYPHDFITTFRPLPRPNDVTDPYIPGGMNNWFQINARSKYQDEAWTFIRYCLEEGAQFMIASGRDPAFPGTNFDQVVAGLLGEEPEKFYDVEAYRSVLQDKTFNFSLPTFSVASAEISKLMQTETDRYLVNEVSLDECMSSIKQQADAAITKAGS